ncbi:MAG: SDR family NAD(P)-dependent oxidoreductase [Spirulinaceae cyanobacterium]
MKYTSSLIVGASRGIGLGFVRKLLQSEKQGRIFATYRRQENAAELLTLRSKYPGKLVCLEMDITDESQIVIAVEKIRSEIDKLHLVVNCVGILHEGQLQPEKSLKQLNPEYLLRYFQVNSIGAVLLAKYFLPLLRHGDRNLLATISAKIGSISDNRSGGWYGYRASKAALNMFMRTTAIEYSRKSPNTIVTVLHPGTTDTQLSEPFQKNVPIEKLFPVEQTITQLLDVIENLTLKDSGEFFSWNGEQLPY